MLRTVAKLLTKIKLHEHIEQTFNDALQQLQKITYDNINIQIPLSNPEFIITQLKAIHQIHQQLTQQLCSMLQLPDGNQLLTFIDEFYRKSEILVTALETFRIIEQSQTDDGGRCQALIFNMFSEIKRYAQNIKEELFLACNKTLYNIKVICDERTKIPSALERINQALNVFEELPEKTKETEEIVAKLIEIKETFPPEDRQTTSVETSALIDSVRISLKKICDRTNSVRKHYTPENRALASASYEALLMLAYVKPLNDLDYITLCDIPQYDRVVFSTGHQFAISGLVDYYHHQQNKFTQKDLLNPATNKLFSFPDLIHFIAELHRLNLFLPVEINRNLAQEKLDLGPHITSRVLATPSLRTLVFKQTLSRNDAQIINSLGYYYVENFQKIISLRFIKNKFGDLVQQELRKHEEPIKMGYKELQTHIKDSSAIKTVLTNHQLSFYDEGVLNNYIICELFLIKPAIFIRDLFTLFSFLRLNFNIEEVISYLETITEPRIRFNWKFDCIVHPYQFKEMSEKFNFLFFYISIAQNIFYTDRSNKKTLTFNKAVEMIMRQCSMLLFGAREIQKTDLAKTRRFLPDLCYALNHGIYEIMPCASVSFFDEYYDYHSRIDKWVSPNHKYFGYANLIEKLWDKAILSEEEINEINDSTFPYKKKQKIRDLIYDYIQMNVTNARLAIWLSYLVLLTEHFLNFYGIASAHNMLKYFHDLDFENGFLYAFPQLPQDTKEVLQFLNSFYRQHFILCPTTDERNSNLRRELSIWFDLQRQFCSQYIDHLCAPATHGKQQMSDFTFSAMPFSEAIVKLPPKTSPSFDNSDQQIDNAIRCYLREEDFSILKQLIDAKTLSPDCIISSVGETLLMKAAQFDDISTAVYLLKRGADPRIVDRYGFSATHYAAIDKNKKEFFPGTHSLTISESFQNQTFTYEVNDASQKYHVLRFLFGKRKSVLRLLIHELYIDAPSSTFGLLAKGGQVSLYKNYKKSAK